MNTHFALRGAALVVAFLSAAHGVWAQAPGEDPVILTKKLTIQMQPTAGYAPSGNLDGNNTTPSWLRARIARYEAKAFSSDTTGILTDNDVVATANAQGMQKTCVQEVGSNTLSSATSPGTKYGPGQATQVVVLRGDLINICK